MVTIIEFHFALNSFAQNEKDYYHDIINVIPPSPNAASLGEYGNIPVGHFTGVPQISIPIWSVQSNELTLPISLSYHAGGFKVNEIASFVGLGWSLNAGGVISRTVIGKQDDEDGLRPPLRRANQYDQQLSSDYNILISIAEGDYDSQPDLYSFNFMGHIGQFVIGDNNSILQMPWSNIQIKKNSKNQFKIIDENGITYYFGTSMDGSQEAVEHTDIDGSSLITGVPTAWYLTDIITPNETNHLEFKYLPAGKVIRKNFSYSEYILHPNDRQISSPYSCADKYALGPSSTVHTTHQLRLSTIKYSQGFVNFNMDNLREDFPNPSKNNGESYKLNSIEILNSNSEVIRTFDLQYSYFGNTNHYLWKRLKLTSVKEIGSNRLDYSFKYNEEVDMPERDSKAIDHWGYYNGADDNTSLLPVTEVFDGEFYGDANRDADQTGISQKAYLIEKIVYPTGGYTAFDFEANQAGSLYTGGARVIRTEDYSDPSKPPVIKAYEYLHSELPYPLHNTSYLDDYITVDHPAMPISGYSDCTDWECRYKILLSSAKGLTSVLGRPIGNTSVKEMIGENGKGGIKWFNYSMNYKLNEYDIMDYLGGYLQSIKDIKLVSGIEKTVKEVIYRYVNESTLNDHILNYLVVNQRKYDLKTDGPYDDNRLIVRNIPLFSIWFYVKEIQENLYDDNDNIISTITNYSYDNPYHGLVTSKSTTLSNGKKKVIQYKYPSDYLFDYSGLIQCTNDYDDDLETAYSALSDCQLERGNNCTSIIGVNCIPIMNGNDCYNQYNCTNIFYSNLQAALNTQETCINNFYDNIANSISGLNDKELALYKLQQLHMLNTPIEEIEIIEHENGSRYVTRATELVYTTSSDKVFIEAINKAELDIPVEESIFNNNKSAYYKKNYNLKFNASTGKLEEHHKENDIPTYYLWAYNNQHVVAQIQTSDETLDIASIQANIDGQDFSNNDDYASINSDINKLKTSLSSVLNNSDYMVTYYTYNPLVGMTSQTDPSEKTIYYLYDDFGRLETIKNDESTILNHFEYNLLGQAGEEISETINITPQSIVFESICAGSFTEWQSCNIENVSNETITGSILLDGTYATHFELDDNNDGNPDATATFSLGQGATKTVRIRFAPKTGIRNISTMLKIDFDNTSLTDASVSVQGTVSDCPLTVPSISLTGTEDCIADFSITVDGGSGNYSYNWYTTDDLATITGSGPNSCFYQTGKSGTDIQCIIYCEVCDDFYNECITRSRFFLLDCDSNPH